MILFSNFQESINFMFTQGITAVESQVGHFFLPMFFLLDA